MKNWKCFSWHTVLLFLSVKSPINTTSKGTEIPEAYKYFMTVAALGE